MSTMIEDTITDLKQFIAITVTQQASDLRGEIQALRMELSTKIDDLSEAVAQVLDAANDDTTAQLQNHELRISKLEQQTA